MLSLPQGSVACSADGQATEKRSNLDSGMVYERTPDQIQVSAQWPLAFETGHWTGRRGANGATIIGGRYSAHWVQRSGRWLIRSEVFVALTCTGEACEWPIAIS